jgi:HlyD family secretion protein
VKLNVASPPPYLRQDMTVSVDIEVARRPSALIMPVADIHDMKTGKPWLLTVEDGHARHQQITVGLVSAGKAEILTGLQEGALVVPTTSKVKDGQPIRVSTPAAAHP